MKHMIKKTSILTLIFLLSISLTAYCSNYFPSPTNLKYVNDYVGIINSSDSKKIISIGNELERKTGAEEVVVVIDSTNGVDIESYANNLFRTWGLGNKSENNGLLILLSLNDKRWRVEIGSGLEGAIPDALSNRIMTSIAKPSFVSGNYSEGLLNAYSAFSDYIATEYNVTLDKSLNISISSNETNYNAVSNRGIAITGGIFLILLALDITLNRGRIIRIFLNILLISSFNRRNGPKGGGGFGGFGGGSSNGGGSSGSW